MHIWKPARPVIAVALVLESLAQAQIVGDYTLDPRTYTSPSGQVTLFVDPSLPSGGGPATYRCMRGEQELWSGTRPYTLWEADLTDDGLVAGYAFAAGYMGGEDDALTIVLIARDGSARLEEHSEREGLLSDIGSPEPMVAGLFLDPENERMVVRARTGSWPETESWWTYSLITGRPGPRQDPRAGLPENARWIEETRVVPGTSLVLVHWYWSDWEAHQDGAVFTLLDPEGEVVWRLDRPEDLTVHGDEEAEDLLQQEIRERGAILAVGHKSFTLRQAATNERATFEVERGTSSRGGWKVREVARAPFTSEMDAPATSSSTSAAGAPPTLALKPLGSIQLGSAPSSRIRDVTGFSLDGLGRPGFLRKTGERFEFVRVDRKGGNAVEISLPGPPKEESWGYALAWTAGERWILTSSGLRQGGRPGSLHAWWLDAGSHAVTPIHGFDAPSVEWLAGTPDGGFVVAGGTLHEMSYMTYDLIAFDRDGKRLFALGGDQGDPKNPKSVFPPEDMTVLGNGEIVVLSQLGNTLQFFSRAGEPLRRIELEKEWGREPNDLVCVNADREGGLIVHDFNGKPSIVRMDGSGKVLGGFDPHFAGGRPFHPRGGVRVGPDGSLWTSDGHSLLVLDPEGAVQRVVGPAPDAQVLGDIAGVTVGPDSRIYAADRRTAAVHVFDASGKLQHVCKPDPADFERDLGPVWLTVTDSGELFLQNIHFAADGTRLGTVHSVGRYAQRGSDRFWRAGHDYLCLIQADGSVARTIQRTPDGRWLRRIGRAGVAPDGSIALATVGDFPGIHLYDASGEPLRSLASPEGMAGWATLAFDGERLAIAVQNRGEPGAVVLMDAHGRTLGRFQPEGEVSLWFPFFAAQGDELWLFDGDRRIERFALP